MNHWRWWKRWLRRFELGGDHDADAMAPVASASDAAHEKETTRRLHGALDKLAPKKRLVLVLCDLDELSASRVAEIVGCGEPTVRSRLRQARLDLAELLSKDAHFCDGGEP